MRKFVGKTFIYLLLLLVVIFTVGYTIPFNPKSFTREQLVKNRLLSNPDRMPSVVLVGGSSVVYGFQTPILIDSLAQPVINDGMQAGLGLKFSIDNCTRFLIPGDTLIIISEYSHFFEKSAWGQLYLADLFYLSPKEFLPLLNIQQIKSIINNTPRHIQSKITYLLTSLINSSEQSGYTLSSFNDFGDKVDHYGVPNVDFYYELPIKEHTDEVNYRYFKILNKQIETLESKGVRVLLFPAPMAESFYISERVNVDYVKKQMELQHHAFMCEPKECVYADSLFYDSYYHLNYEGSRLNSIKLANTLKGASNK